MSFLKGKSQDSELRQIGEAGLAMLLTVGAPGSIIVIVACTVLPVPWLAGIGGLLIAWLLFTWDFIAAEREARSPDS